MTREALAIAFDKAAEAFAELAHELRASEPSGGRPDVPTSVPTGPAESGGGSPPAPAARPRQQDSAFTECPAHRREWTEGKFGAYCTAQSDDPDWSNDKGYCRVTPRSAGAWLRQHPKVTA